MLYPPCDVLYRVIKTCFFLPRRIAQSPDTTLAHPFLASIRLRAHRRRPAWKHRAGRGAVRRPAFTPGQLPSCLKAPYRADPRVPAVRRAGNAGFQVLFVLDLDATPAVCEIADLGPFLAGKVIVVQRNMP